MGRIPIAALVAFLLALLLFATMGVGQAQAQTYTKETFSCASGTPTRVSDSGSGSYDNNGNLYIPCGSTATNAASIYKIDPQGVRTKVKDVAYDVSDVAPSPTGNYLYLAKMNAPPVRLNRAADGTYSQDATWKLGTYTMDAATGWTIPHAEGAFIDTDDAGNIYIADGAFTNNGIHTVVKYAPAGGTALTRFGSKHTTWELGYFYHQLNGLAVKGDGSKVYTVEGGNNRVQVWTRGGTTATSPYTATSSFGGNATNNSDRGGYCKYDGWEGKFASPYDIALDATEANLFILNTTCHQVMKFSTGGVYGSSERVGTDNAAQDNRPHGFAVAKNGEVYIAQSGVKLALTTPPSGSCFGVTLTKVGTEGIDDLSGTNGVDDTISALGGNDTIRTIGGGAGNDRMCGGAGYDTFKGNYLANAMLDGANKDAGATDDAADMVSYATATTPDGTDGVLNVDLDGTPPVGDVFPPGGGYADGGNFVHGLYSISDVEGSNYRDGITGNNVNNSLYGLSGNDTITGEGGKDAFFGDDGDDTLNTRDGVVETTIDCGAGTDTANVDASEAANAVGCETVNTDDPTIDTQAPQNGTISITGSTGSNAGYTRTRQVTLNLSATDNVGVTRVSLADNDGVWDTTAAYSTSISYTLPSNATQGTNYVSVRFHDAKDNISEIYRASIKLDTVAPSVIKTEPANLATGIPRTTALVAHFAATDLKPSTVNATSYYMRKNGTTTNIPMKSYSYSTDRNRAIMWPSTTLLAKTGYTVFINNKMTDEAGNPIKDQNASVAGYQPKKWSFTTGG